jgi:hypothetical protein
LLPRMNVESSSVSSSSWSNSLNMSLNQK